MLDIEMKKERSKAETEKEGATEKEIVTECAKEIGRK